ncbi:MAG: UDP-glucose 4-epimerase GalE [Candidatus Sumerlaeaceae bacterium]|nr:UDP-glucose 4-epimerase GalE [Candidatus Sumerlaeaceae bacterium]
MNVLVAGGAGYIGSATVEKLVDAGHNVVVVDNLSRGHAAAVSKSARFEVGDISDRAFMDGVLSSAKFDVVMHFCAFSLVGESVTDPMKYYENNVSGGMALVKAMLAHGVKRLIFSSTAAIFGEPAVVPIPETAPKQPTNPYGRSKAAFEQFLQDCDTAYGLKSICLRYFNAAGATKKVGECHNPETHLIPIVLETALGRRKEVQIFGRSYLTQDGTGIRDYIHVSDLAQAHILAAEYLVDSNEGDQFNLGNGHGYSVLEVLEAAEAVTGKKIARKFAPRRAGDPAILVASSDKIREKLEWEPEYPELEDIIQSAWDWMQKNPDGYNKPPAKAKSRKK